MDEETDAGELFTLQGLPLQWGLVHVDEETDAIKAFLETGNASLQWGLVHVDEETPMF